MSASSLLFTPSNWSSKQSVTVTGVNDSAVDGSATYTVVLGNPTSTDTAYADINPPDVELTNTDKMMNDPAFGEKPEQRRQLLYKGGLKIYTTLDPRIQKASLRAKAGEGQNR